MRLDVNFWRVISFNKPQGPWRAFREEARRDAVALGLGSYDEQGVFYKTVPGDIQVLTMETRTLRQALEAALGPDQVITDIGSLTRAKRRQIRDAQPSKVRARQSKRVLRR